MDPSQSPASPADFITLKIVVPHASACKTVRLPTKIKIKELHGILTKKLSTVSNSTPQQFEDFGFYWHSDSGPVWLAEASALRAYKFKPGVSIEFKSRSNNGLSPSTTSALQKTKESKKEAEALKKSNGSSKHDKHDKHKHDKEKEKHEKDKHEKDKKEIQEPMRISAIKKVSAWVSSRPGSFYDQKKEKEKEEAHKMMKKERSQSMNLSSKKELDTVRNRTTSPSYSSNFESSTPTSSPLLPVEEDNSSSSSPRGFEYQFASLDDLDDLIDDFDDLADDYDGTYDNDDKFLDEYVARIEDEDILESLPKSSEDTIPSPRYNYETTPSISPSSASPIDSSIFTNGTRQRSYSSPHGSGFFPQIYGINKSKSAKSTPSASPRYSSSPDALDSSNPDDFRKVPGLSGAAKRDVNPASNSVRVAAVTSILEDALEGLESNSVDLNTMKHYVTSALCILRTLS